MRARGASIQTAATKVTNIGDRLSLWASVLPLPAANQDFCFERAIVIPLYFALSRSISPLPDAK